MFVEVLRESARDGLSAGRLGPDGETLSLSNNPVKRGLVRSLEEWPWSSFRFYYLNDTSLLGMDKLV
jgi:hypothetical protein